MRVPNETIYALNFYVGFTRAEAETMTAVVLAESGGRTDNPNPGGTGVGLYQINPKAHGAKWIEDGKKPVTSAFYARKLFVERKFIPWEAYTNGKYLRFLPDAKIANSKFQVISDGVDLKTVDRSKMSEASRKIWDGWTPAHQRDFLAAQTMVFSLGISLPIGEALEKGLGGGFDTLETASGAATGYLADLTGKVWDLPLMNALAYVVAAAKWASDRQNWVRVALALAGGSLLVVAVLNVAGETPASAAKKVAKATPYGRAAKGAGKAGKGRT